MIGGFVDLVEGLFGVLDLIDTAITLLKSRRRAIVILSVLSLGALAIWLIARSS